MPYYDRPIKAKLFAKYQRIAARYSSRADFRREQYNVYSEASKYGVLNALCAHMTKNENVQNLSSDRLIARYSVTDDKYQDWSLYCYLSRRGLLPKANAVRAKAIEKRARRSGNVVKKNGWTIER